MSMACDHREEKGFRLEVPDRVYRRLVRMLISSVMQEKNVAARKSVGNKQKGVV